MSSTVFSKRECRCGPSPAVPTRPIFPMASKWFVATLAILSRYVRHCAGVDRLFLFPVDGTATGVMDAARGAGVSRVVVLSSVSAAYGESDLSGDYHRAVEVAVEESEIPWTHIRPGEFMMNLLDWAPSIAAENVVRAPFADQESNAVHEADIADVAAVALLHDGHEGHAYEVNGPETLTRAEQAQVIGTAIGQDVRF